MIEIWTDATSRLDAAMENNTDKTNPIYMMVLRCSRKHGADAPDRRDAWSGGQPEGEIIARPIKSNFREGLYNGWSTSSPRMMSASQADTALRTADSGYLTRRLVDVSQDVIIREEETAAPSAASPRRLPLTTVAATSSSTSTWRPPCTHGRSPPMCSLRTVRCC